MEAENVIDGMQAHMGRIRFGFERARAVRRYAETVKLGAFHGRITRVLLVDDTGLGDEGVRSELATFHVDTAFADGALRREAGGGISAEPADCGRIYGLVKDGVFSQPFALAEGPLRPGERRRCVGASGGRPLFHAPRSFLP